MSGVTGGSRTDPPMRSTYYAESSHNAKQQHDDENQDEVLDWEEEAAASSQPASRDKGPRTKTSADTDPLWSADPWGRASNKHEHWGWQSPAGGGTRSWWNWAPWN